MKKLTAFILGILFSIFIIGPIALSFKTEIKILINHVLYYFEENPEIKQVNQISDLDNVVWKSTSHLPIVAGEINLTTAGFAPGAGRILAKKDILYLLSRKGDIYSYAAKNLKKITTIPTGYAKFEARYGGENSDSARSLDLDIDCSKSQIFVSHVAYDVTNKEFSLQISVADINCQDGTIKNTWKSIFNHPLSQHEALNSHAIGGSILISNDHLYLSLGLSNENVQPGQQPEAFNIDNYKGKILEIDLKDNSTKIISSGHRNVTSIIKLENTNKLYSVEHGLEGGDELNQIRPGANYGFPYVSYGTGYGSYNWINNVEPILAQNQYQKPVFSFVPSIAPSDMIETTSFNDAWKNDLLITGLKSRGLFRLKLEDNQVRYVEPIYFGTRLRSIAELKSKLYILSDTGILLEITVDEAAYINDNPSPDLPLANSILKKCVSCHALSDTNQSMAPTLKGIYNKHIATGPFSTYSDALKALSTQKWTDANLEKYLKDPQIFSPGTSMPNQHLSAKQIQEVINQLKKLN
jgi:glucose/arabinose dehydrogenase/cytochrome c2